jgi:hypothetical protein
LSSVALHYSDDVLEIARDGMVYLRRGDLVDEIAQEIAEATGRKIWVSSSPSRIYVSLSTEDGLEAVAKLQAAVKSGTDDKTVHALIEEIARASTRGDGERVVLGAWQEGGGYIDDAVKNGGMFFDTGDEVWQMLQSAGIDPWKVNEAFMQIQMEQGKEFVNVINFADKIESRAVEAALRLDEEGIRIALGRESVPYRFREIMWLVQQGFSPLIEERKIIWIHP